MFLSRQSIEQIQPTYASGGKPKRSDAERADRPRRVSPRRRLAGCAAAVIALGLGAYASPAQAQHRGHAGHSVGRSHSGSRHSGFSRGGLSSHTRVSAHVRSGRHAFGSHGVVVGRHRGSSHRSVFGGSHFLGRHIPRVTHHALPHVASHRFNSSHNRAAQFLSASVHFGGAVRHTGHVNHVRPVLPHRAEHTAHGIAHVRSGHVGYGVRVVTPGHYGIGYSRVYAPPPVVVYRDVYEPAFVRYEDSYAAPNESSDRVAAGSELSEGARLMKSRDYETAADVFFQAVLAEPSAGLPKLLFGHALCALGDYDYAAYVIRRAVDRLDDPVPADWSVDVLYADANEFERQIYKLHHHTQRHEADADAHFLLGYFRFFAGRPAEAARSLDHAIRLNASDRHASALRRRLPDPPGSKVVEAE
ncbi:MAG: tetratricopeptide repeat protein [Phycisphaerae bacterium]